MQRFLIALSCLWLVALGALWFMPGSWLWSPPLDAAMPPTLSQSLWEPEVADGTLYRWTRPEMTINVLPGTTTVHMLLRARDTTVLRVQPSSTFDLNLTVERQRRWMHVYVPSTSPILIMKSPAFIAPSDGRPLGVVLEQLGFAGSWHRAGLSQLSIWLLSFVPLLAALAVEPQRFWLIRIAMGSLVLLGCLLLVALAPGWMLRAGASMLLVVTSGAVMLRYAKPISYGWLWSIPIATIGMALVFAAAPLIPAHLIWGLHPFLRVPASELWPGLALLIGVLLYQFDLPPILLTRWLWIGLGAIVIGGCALLLPVTHVEGDGLTILGYIESGMRVHWKQPLDFWLHAMLYRLLDGTVAEPARMSYRILSTAAGFGYGAIAADWAWRWSSSFWRRLATWLLLCNGGWMVLFAGYIESYALVTVALLAYMWASYCAYHQTMPLWVAGLCLGLAIVLHPIALWAVPSALMWLWWRGVSRDLLSLLIGLGLPIALVVIGFTLAGHGPWTIGANKDSPGGYDGAMFVPWTDPNGTTEQYSMLSVDHLVAWINVLLLSSPLVLVALAWLQPWQNSFALFIQLLVVSALGWAFIWNPDLGAQQDWDLFSIAGLPLAVIAAWSLNTTSSKLARLISPTWLGLCLINLLSWLMIHRIDF